ncbi:MAG: 1-acyl-sn-glycerol-3-phosphate acyltransferase, partial [Prolixibacteraceae bacterium]|nr:1-acyl-sn-glycerol-3-phosphate acyltransferase [Prolixibacteraceae bacterium]
MKIVLSYLLSPVYLLFFGLLLVVFHPIQIVCRFFGGYELRKKSVDIMNFFIVYGFIILGSRIRFIGFGQLPKNRP